MKHFHTRRVILLLLGIPVLTSLSGAAFSQPCDQWAGKMVSVQGSV